MASVGLSIVIGAIEVYWGQQENRKVKPLLAWADDLRALSTGERKEIRATLKRFCKQSEDYLAGRIRCRIQEVGFFRSGFFRVGFFVDSRHNYFRGQGVGDRSRGDILPQLPRGHRASRA